jgi:hypothetical protein
MAWELLAIWAIVAATIIWFVRDERRQQHERNDVQARLYAAAPQWSHREDTAAKTLARSAETDAMRRRVLRGMMSDRPFTTR